MAAAEVAVGLYVTDHGFDGGTAPDLAFDHAEHATLPVRPGLAFTARKPSALGRDRAQPLAASRVAKNLPSEGCIEQLRNWKGGLVPSSCAHRYGSSEIAKFGLINRRRPLRALPLCRLFETMRTPCAQMRVFRV